MPPSDPQPARRSRRAAALRPLLLVLLACDPAITVGGTSATGDLAAPAHVGSAECAMCHKAQYEDWRRTKHARAHDLLKPGQRRTAKRRADLDPTRDYTTDQECLKCHTTGFRQPGGFISMRDTPDQAGIGCEACHGPGQWYRELHKSRRGSLDHAELEAAGQWYASEDPGVCTACHEHEDTPFQPDLDDKYVFDPAERLSDTRSYHRSYP